MEQVPIRAWKLVVTTLVGVAAGGGYHQLATSCRDVPYHFVDDLVADGLRANAGRELRVHGWIRAGSLTQREGKHSFLVERRGVALRVTATSPPAEAIRDQAEVIVTGRLVEDNGWTLAGSVVVAKCGGYKGSTEDVNASKFQ